MVFLKILYVTHPPRGLEPFDTFLLKYCNYMNKEDRRGGRMCIVPGGGEVPFGGRVTVG